MIVVDTSALVAIMFREPERELFLRAIGTAAQCLISAGNHLETAIVLGQRRGSDAVKDLDTFIERAAIVTAEVSRAQIGLARAAYRSFGKGNHPAALNFGDCFAYALAKDLDAPLLFKGNDFSQTDLRAALRA